MSLIGLYADPHFSQSSSIIVGKRGDFSGRLDNLIRSFDWMNQLFQDHKVDQIICLGDMTDKPNLTAEEITALSKCHIDHHILLVGNHCRSDTSGSINSLNLFSRVIYNPEYLDDKQEVLMLPYSSTVIEFKENPKIILSHNDLKGYNFGYGHVSSAGYEISEILDHCQLFINGHLHNGGWVVKDRIMNLGMLSGMNFSSCGGEWEPSVAILDTDTLKIELFTNPIAYRFKKISCSSLIELKKYLDKLPEEGEYVLQVKVPSEISIEVRKLLDQSRRVVASRVISEMKVSSQVKESPTKEVTPTKSIYRQLQEYFDKNYSSKYDLTLVNQIINKLERSQGES